MGWSVVVATASRIAKEREPASPEAEQLLWYQYYLHGERGYKGLSANRKEFCKLLWDTWSPTWRFSEEDFASTALSFSNPDFVDVVTHSYRHRFGLADGDPAYEQIESRLAAQPEISVPTIVLEGLDDAVDPPKQNDPFISHFVGPYRRDFANGAGHNVPQEAAQQFADCILGLGQKV